MSIVIVQDGSDPGQQWSYDAAEILGSGRRSTVFAGVDMADKPVAVKRIPDGGVIAELGRESEIGRVLQSRGGLRHLVVPLGIARTEHDLCIIMPRADRVLTDVIAAGDLTEGRAIDILRQVIDGLSELHTLAINYRDLKPDNTLEVDGRWCLSDFGISRDLNAATASETMGHLGTSPYMAPEVWERKPNTTISDLYSFGVLAYELFAGHVPFAETTDSELMRAHLHHEPTPLPDSVAPGVRRLVTRLLRKSPSERPQDARAVRESLDRLTRNHSGNHSALLSAAADDARRAAAAEARSAALALLEQERIESRQRALTGLADMFEDARESILELGLDDIEVSNSGAQWTLLLGSAHVTASPWNWLPRRLSRDGTEIIVAGQIFVGNFDSVDKAGFHTLDGSAANLVYSLDQAPQRRGNWELWRYQFAGGSRSGDGVSEADFRTKYDQDNSNDLIQVSYITRRDDLNVDTLVYLLTEAFGG